MSSFQCNKCGRNYRHVTALPVFCPCGNRAAPEGWPAKYETAYEDDRQRICNVCEHNKAGVCLELQKITPDKACLISIGVRMPKAHCPIGKWERVP